MCMRTPITHYLKVFKECICTYLGFISCCILLLIRCYFEKIAEGQRNVSQDLNLKKRKFIGEYMHACEL